MKIQEIVEAKLWEELRKQINPIKPIKKTAQKTAQPKTTKASDLERATAKITSAVARLKPQSPVKPVAVARPSKPR